MQSNRQPSVSFPPRPYNNHPGSGDFFFYQISTEFPYKWGLHSAGKLRTFAPEIRKQRKKIIQELNFRRVVQVWAEGPKFIGAARPERKLGQKAQSS